MHVKGNRVASFKLSSYTNGSWNETPSLLITTTLMSDTED